MTTSELKAKLEERGSCFFSPKTMRFFGDTMKNYGCRIVERNGTKLIELYRRKPVKHGLQTSAYFDPETFRQVWPVASN